MAGSGLGRPARLQPAVCTMEMVLEERCIPCGAGASCQMIRFSLLIGHYQCSLTAISAQLQAASCSLYYQLQVPIALRRHMLLAYQEEHSHRNLHWIFAAGLGLGFAQIVWGRGWQGPGAAADLGLGCAGTTSLWRLADLAMLGTAPTLLCSTLFACMELTVTA